MSENFDKCFENGVSLEDQKAMIEDGLKLRCSHQHPGLTCLMFALQKFLITSQRFSVFFIPMHLVPMLIFKRKELKSKQNQPLSSPKQTILHTIKGCLKSTLFLSSMVGIIRYVLCKLKTVKEPLNGKHGLLIGLCSGISILCESDGKACEMTLQLFPRFCEATFHHLQKRIPQLNKLNNLEFLLFSLILGLIHYCYQHNNAALKQTYRKLFFQFWGKN